MKTTMLVIIVLMVGMIAMPAMAQINANNTATYAGNPGQFLTKSGYDRKLDDMVNKEISGIKNMPASGIESNTTAIDANIRATHKVVMSDNEKIAAMNIRAAYDAIAQLKKQGAHGIVNDFEIKMKKARYLDRQGEIAANFLR